MSWFLDYSPIFFDLDGLLINSEPLHYRAYKMALEQEGIVLPWDFSTYLSKAHQDSSTLRLSISSLCPALSDQKAWKAFYLQKKEAFEKLLIDEEILLMPGAQTMVETVQCAGIPHAVVTNSTRRQTELIREKIPFLKAIPHFITREDYALPKPSPDAYLKAIEQVGYSDKMIGFEDSRRGVEALRSAKITSVLIGSQVDEHPIDADHHYSSFEALMKRHVSLH